MKTRLEIQNSPRQYEDLILEVLLDIRDILVKAAKKPRKKANASVRTKV